MLITKKEALQCISKTGENHKARRVKNSQDCLTSSKFHLNNLQNPLSEENQPLHATKGCKQISNLHLNNQIKSAQPSQHSQTHILPASSFLVQRFQYGTRGRKLFPQPKSSPFYHHWVNNPLFLNKDKSQAQIKQVREILEMMRKMRHQLWGLGKNGSLNKPQASRLVKTSCAHRRVCKLPMTKAIS